MAERRPTRIFLSYAPQDSDWAKEFAAALREAGVTGVFDASELLPGDLWVDRTEEALRQSRVFVLIVSPHTRESPQALFELGAAMGDDKRIIPVLVDDVPAGALPPFVRKYQPLRESSPRAAGERLADALTKLDAA